MKKLSPRQNFADIAETAKKQLTAKSSDELKSLAGMIVVLAKRCDLLERQVEVLGEKLEAR